MSGQGARRGCAAPRSSQPAADLTWYRIRYLPARVMPRALYPQQACAGNTVGHVFGQRDRLGLVFAADDQQGQHGDFLQTFQYQ